MTLIKITDIMVKLGVTCEARLNMVSQIVITILFFFNHRNLNKTMDFGQKYGDFS